MPTVSVLIPTWNRPKWLRESLLSVLSQDVDLEVLVVDNGSGPETEAVLSEFRIDRRVRTWRLDENDPGVYAFLLAQALGEFCVMWTDDDRMCPGNLSSKVKFLRDHHTIGMVFGPVVNINADGEVIGVGNRPFETAIGTGAAAFKYLYRVNYINMISVVFRREIAPDLATFDNYEGLTDWMFWLHLSNRADSAYLPDPMVELRLHRGAESNTQDGKFMDQAFRIWQYWADQGHKPDDDDIAHMRAACLAMADGKFTRFCQKLDTMQ